MSGEGSYEGNDKTGDVQGARETPRDLILKDQ